MRLRALRFGLGVFAWMTACADSSDGTDAAAGSVSGPEVEVGQFSVQLVPPRPATALSAARAGSTTILGSVGDKPVAEPIVWETRTEQAGCRLLVPRVPFCDPVCAGEVCVEDDTCEPDRKLLNVGSVTVSGVTTDSGASEVVLTSVRNTYQNGITELPYPAFGEGDAIALGATGADSIAAFDIVARGIAALEVPEGSAYVVAEGEALALTWTPPGRAELSRIQIKLDISHHGGTKGKIECDVEDNGAFTLPAALSDELLALGVAGFPSIVLTRSSSETAQLAIGRVRLRVYEYAERFVSIPGVVSCASPDDCPSDQTCRDDKTCG